MTHKVVGLSNEQVARLVQYLAEGNTIEDLAVLYLESLNDQQLKDLQEEVSQLGWAEDEQTD